MRKYIQSGKQRDEMSEANLRSLASVRPRPPGPLQARPARGLPLRFISSSTATGRVVDGLRSACVFTLLYLLRVLHCRYWSKTKYTCIVYRQ